MGKVWGTYHRQVPGPGVLVIPLARSAALGGVGHLAVGIVAVVHFRDFVPGEYVIWALEGIHFLDESQDSRISYRAGFLQTFRMTIV